MKAKKAHKQYLNLLELKHVWIWISNEGEGSFVIGTHITCLVCIFILENTSKPAAWLSHVSSVGVGVEAGVLVSSGSSVLHLLTLPKVMRAFKTWNRGISVGKKQQKQMQDSTVKAVFIN